ncbi:MAG TPA: type III-A CRISPR-associated RAMP protein Csm3 [Candidatus Angelobacter sp.]|nr:type III-A CRISPR-associated RAMP protein Csm3 [Candidatus Angelobacter sp.]
MAKKWTDVWKITFEIECLDGMRIGGSGGGLEIGGVDANLTALKDPVSGEPYIPGSSLKGKLRSILEQKNGKGEGGSPCKCGSEDCPVCPVFGAHMNTRAGAPRLIVRDAHFTEAYRKKWEENPVYEEKTENTIDRQRGTASNPRTQERVPAGAVFQAELVLKVFQGDNDNTMIQNLKQALGILQEFDSLGAGGSRGSGWIKIRNFKEEKKALKDVTLDGETLKK